jgi:AraC-like DNA-binding protein
VTDKSLCRAGPMAGLAEAAAGIGFDVGILTERVGTPYEAFRDPDVRLPVPMMLESLACAAHATGHTDIALLAARQIRIAHMGVLGQGIKEQVSLLAAAEMMRKHFNLDSPAIGVTCTVSADRLEVQVFARHSTGLRLGHLPPLGAELGVAALFRLLAELSPAPLQPLGVSFVHERHTELDSYRRVFGIEPMFNQESNSFTLALADITRTRPGSNIVSAGRAALQLEQIALARAIAPTVRERLHDTLFASLPHAFLDLGEAANQLGVSRRTLNRHLALEGATFQDVAQDVRKRAAASFLEYSSKSLLEISNLLGFAEQSGFSRWFRNAFGYTPSEHRHRAGV